MNRTGWECWCRQIPQIHPPNGLRLLLCAGLNELAEGEFMVEGQMRAVPLEVVGHVVAGVGRALGALPAGGGGAAAAAVADAVARLLEVAKHRSSQSPRLARAHEIAVRGYCSLGDWARVEAEVCALAEAHNTGLLELLPDMRQRLSASLWNRASSLYSVWWRARFEWGGEEHGTCPALTARLFEQR